MLIPLFSRESCCTDHRLISHARPSQRAIKARARAYTAVVVGGMLWHRGGRALWQIATITEGGYFLSHTHTHTHTHRLVYIYIYRTNVINTPQRAPSLLHCKSTLHITTHGRYHVINNGVMDCEYAHTHTRERTQTHARTTRNHGSSN